MKISHSKALECVIIIEYLADIIKEEKANVLVLSPELVNQIKTVWKEVEEENE